MLEPQTKEFPLDRCSDGSLFLSVESFRFPGGRVASLDNGPRTRPVFSSATQAKAASQEAGPGATRRGASSMALFADSHQEPPCYRIVPQNSHAPEAPTVEIQI